MTCPRCGARAYTSATRGDSYCMAFCGWGDQPDIASAYTGIGEAEKEEYRQRNGTTRARMPDSTLFRAHAKDRKCEHCGHMYTPAGITKHQPACGRRAK